MSTCGQMVTQLPHPPERSARQGGQACTRHPREAQGRVGEGHASVLPSVPSLTIPSTPSAPPPASLVLADFIMAGDSLFLGLLSSHLVFCPLNSSWPPLSCASLTCTWDQPSSLPLAPSLWGPSSHRPSAHQDLQAGTEPTSDPCPSSGLSALARLLRSLISRACDRSPGEALPPSAPALAGESPRRPYSHPHLGPPGAQCPCTPACALPAPLPECLSSGFPPQRPRVALGPGPPPCPHLPRQPQTPRAPGPLPPSPVLPGVPTRTTPGPRPGPLLSCHSWATASVINRLLTPDISSRGLSSELWAWAPGVHSTSPRCLAALSTC